MKNKIRNFFTVNRLMISVGLLIALILLCTMGCVGGSIAYTFNNNNTVFYFKKAICGNSGFLETYSGISGYNTYSLSYFKSDSIGVAMIIIAYVLIFVSMLTAFIFSIVKNNKIRKIITLGCGGVAFAFSIIVFLSPVFAKNVMIKDIMKESYLPSLERYFYDCKVNGFVPAGIFSLIASGLVIGSAFIKEMQLSELKDATFIKKTCNVFTSIIRFIQNIGEGKPKKEPENEPNKKLVPKVSAEVIESPKVDVDEDANKNSDPEIERYSIGPDGEEKPQEEKKIDSPLDVENKPKKKSPNKPSTPKSVEKNNK